MKDGVRLPEEEDEVGPPEKESGSNQLMEETGVC